MKESIVIDILDDGEIKIETRGFKGSLCVKESQFIKEILGEEIQRILTPMYYEAEPVVIKKHINFCG